MMNLLKLKLKLDACFFFFVAFVVWVTEAVDGAMMMTLTIGR